MSIILWVIAALAAVLAGVAIAMRVGLEHQPPQPHGERVPSTPLQQIARRSLLLGLLPALTAVGLVFHFGPVRFDSDSAVRLPITGLLVVSVLVFAGLAFRTRSMAARDDGTLDERDRAILDRAAVAQSVAVIVALAAWVVGLAEAYHATHLVPSIFLYLVFWSCLIVNLAAFPIGILLGYRRA
jgi:hypothetical protein